MSFGMRGIRTLMHVGDFGVWPGVGGRAYVRTIEKACSRFGVTIFVTPGNHEDYDQIDALAHEDRGHDIAAVQWMSDHIALLPRGHRWTWNDRTFVSLGGAPSVDFEDRVPGREWWAAEMIALGDVERTVDGGYADVMLAHDGPDRPWQTRAVQSICATNPQGWSDTALAYAAIGRRRMTQAFLGVKPRLFVHGHYHVFDEAEVALPECNHTCHIVSLNCDGGNGNVSLLNLKDLSVSAL
jgi:hypothetical protein